MGEPFDTLRATWPAAQKYPLDRFAALVDELGPGHAGFLLGVTRPTLRRWLLGRADVPHAAGELLWQLSRYGKNARQIELENRLRYAEGLARALQARIGTLEAELLATARQVPPRAANDAWTRPDDPRSRIYR